MPLGWLPIERQLPPPHLTLALSLHVHYTGIQRIDSPDPMHRPLAHQPSFMDRYPVSVAAPVFRASSCSCDAPRCHPLQLTQLRDVACLFALPGLLSVHSWVSRFHIVSSRTSIALLASCPRVPLRLVYADVLSASVARRFPQTFIQRWRTPLCSTWLRNPDQKSRCGGEVARQLPHCGPCTIPPTTSTIKQSSRNWATPPPLHHSIGWYIHNLQRSKSVPRSVQGSRRVPCKVICTQPSLRSIDTLPPLSAVLRATILGD
jgi:hypothetical protein